jgi:uncharacterized RDD family membrane protein YckC
VASGSAAPGSAADAALAPAGLWRRSMAATYESVLLFGVVVFFGYGFSALLRFHGAPGPMRWAFQAFLFVVVGAYFVWFWSRGRRTLPMKTVGLWLVDADGRAPTPARAALRYACAWLLLLAPAAAASAGGPAWLLLLPVPYFWAAFDRQRRTLYDRLSGTRLVVEPGTTP